MADNFRQVGPLLVGDQPLPHNSAAELAVLSCMLQDPSTMDTVISKLQNESAFYIPAHRKLFQGLADINRKLRPGDVVDMITVLEYLETHKFLDEIGGEEFLNKAFNTVPSTANIEKYLTLVHDKSLMRNMIATCSDIVGRCYQAEDEIPELVDKVEQEIMKITEAQIDIRVRDMPDLLQEAMTMLDRLSKKDLNTMGLPTGFHQLDKLITGLRPGEMFVLAARPSIGKTTFAMNVAQNVARAGFPVAVFSLEMGAEQVAMRMICSEAKVNLGSVRDGTLTAEDWQDRIYPAVQRLSEMKIFIDDTPQITSMDLRQKSRRLKRDHDIQFIMIDYLQLMRAVGMNKNSNREQEVARMSSDIKALARELQVPIMILAQLNRAAEGGVQPKISNLRESGSIEQDADVVGLLHRERETDSKEVAENVAQGGAIDSQLIIAKHRNGPTGVVPLSFYPRFTLFDTPALIDEEDIPN
ncbi:MAG: replicative DNA helicase [Lentisphaeria bacterium]|nr:replicative DNA helicase [Lentisphaeria bacterium]